MSGGYFNHSDFHIGEIADSIESAIVNDDLEFSPDTLERFSQTVDLLRTARIAVRRIDYLLEGDDREDDFHHRWDEEMQKLEEEKP